MKSTAKSVLRASLLILLLIFLPAFFLALILFVSAETINSRILAIALILFYLSIIILLGAINSKRHTLMLLLSTICFAIFVFGLIISYRTSPSGTLNSNAPINSIISPPSDFIRWSPANLVSEIDQMKLGSLIIPFIDPFIDQKKGKRFKKLFMDVYREMSTDASFAELTPATHYAYVDLARHSSNTQHIFCYIPNNSDKKVFPVIIFLHGAFGNLKGYMWVWKKLADQHQVAIIAPTFGFGFWYRENGIDAINNALQYCTDHPSLSNSNIILAGLSNGGIGISRALIETNINYQALIYISGVLHPRIITSDKFISRCAKLPVCIVHGNLDLRLPKEELDDRIQLLYQNGISPHTIFYDDEDHLLFFSKRDELVNVIADWLLSNELLEK